MKVNKSGFTLIEIIVSLAIFALISVGFFGVFSRVFINTYQASELTEATFEAQKLLENRIIDVKSKLKNSLHDEIDVEEENHSIFSSLGASYSRTVVVYPIQESLPNGEIIESLVSQSRPPQLRVPVIVEPNPVLITANTTKIEPYPNIGMKQLLTINAHTPTRIDNQSYLIHMLHYWYVSNQKFYIPYQSPVFVDDFQVVPSYSGSVIPVIPDSFSGKFIQLMMTPVGEKGQMGQSVPSNPILISGMPINNNLLLHWDASYINVGSSTEVYTSSFRVRQWKNISDSSFYENTQAENNAPVVIDELLGIENLRQIRSIQRFPSGSNQSLSLSSSIGSKQNLTVYFAVKVYGNEELTEPSVAPDVLFFETNIGSSTNKFELYTNSEGELEVRRTGSSSWWSGTPTRSVKVDYNFRTGKWAIFKVDLLTNRTSLHGELVNSENVYTFNHSYSDTSSLSDGMNLNSIRANFAFGYNVGEVMIFDGEQSSEDSQAILKYLYEKYIMD